MNTATTPRGLKPSVRRIAISVRLSFTTMIRVATILNTATATMSIRINPIMVFSMRMARKYAWLSLGPIAHRKTRSEPCRGDLRELRGFQHIGEFEPYSARTRQRPERLRVPAN